MADSCAEQPRPVHPLDAALEQLVALDALLRARGFAHSPDRWLNVKDLLLCMAKEGRLPQRPAALRALMAPLFCRSPEEQARFGDVFACWLAGWSQQAPETSPESPPESPQPDIPRARFWPLALALVVVIGLASVFVYRQLPPKPPGTALPRQQIPLQIPALEDPETIAEDTRRTVPPQPILPRPSIETPVLDRRHDDLLEAADTLLPWIFPILVSLVLLWRWWRRRIVLRRRHDDARDPLIDITLTGIEDGLFGSPNVRAALRRLHIPVGHPTRRLNLSATVETTVRRAGLFCPVYCQRLAVPEVVTLVEFFHRADHIAGLGELVAQRLREAGLIVHRYDYQRDPTVALRPKGGWIGLSELAARHPGSRLLLAGDPAVLLDVWTEAPLPWTEALAAWPERGLLHTRRSEKGWLNALQASGFAVAPLSSAGLIALCARLSGAPPVPEPESEEGLPLLLQDEGIWLQTTPPEKPQRAALLDRLRVYLGGPGFLLLSAMAFYPALHWGLTRALDLSLFPGGKTAAERERRLLRVGGLPWARHGWMPDWLREALLRRLTPLQRERVGALYRELLQQASVGNGSGIQLPIALPLRAASRWLRFLEHLRPGGRTLARYLRDLFARAPTGSLLEDRIFCNLILGGRLGLLDFELPRWLTRHLPGLHLVAAIRPLALAILVAVAGSRLTVALWTHWGRSIAAEAPEKLGGIPKAHHLHVSSLEADRTGNRFRDPLSEPLSAEQWRQIARSLAPEPVVPQAPPSGSSPRRPSELPPKRPAPQYVLVPREPEMVELAGGTFNMGCVSGKRCADDELPAHEVTINPFAISKYEVTFDEYDDFAKSTVRGMQGEWRNDEEWGRGQKPWIHVSWDDATAYARWLSLVTGETYRLPTEAEWEYAARAGTITPFSTGECITTEQANYYGPLSWENCPAMEFYRSRTVAVGSLPPNPWGLHEVHGNVHEWVQDCWHESYEGAPVDGSAWEEGQGGDCTRRVVRGGSWSNGQECLRSANRFRFDTDFRRDNLGFRLARDN